MTTRSTDFFEDLRTPDTKPATHARRGRRPLSDEEKAKRAEATRQRQAAAKLREQNEIRTRAGFPAVKQLNSTNVTFVNRGGQQTFLALRKKYEETAKLGQGAFRNVIEAVRSENRKSFEVALGDIRVDAEGKITRGQGGVHMDEHTVRQLAERLHMHRAGAYLCTLPGHMRSGNFNYAIDQLRKRENSESTSHLFKKPAKKHERRHVQIRIRNGESKPHSFAITGTGFRHDKDADQLASTLAELYPTARGTAAYDAATTRSRFELIWMAPPEAVHDLVVGETFKVGARITSSDRGDRSICVKPFIAEVACINMTVATHVVDLAKVRHTSKKTAKQILDDCVGEALAGLRPFLRDWNLAEITGVVKGSLAHADVEPVFARLVKEGLVSVSGMDDETLVRKLRKAYWDSNPTATVKGVVDAVTRMAHTEPWASPWTVDDLQEQAGQLISMHEEVAAKAKDALAAAKEKGWTPGRFALDTERGRQLLEEAPVYVL